jgi:hypothetical protein
MNEERKMKREMACGLLLLSLSFGVYATDTDSCSVNIQSIKNTMNSVPSTDPVKKLVTQNLADAQKAKKDGNMDKCIAITSRTMAKLKLYNK